MKVFDPWNHGKWIDKFEATLFEDSEIVVMPGGSDIHPAYYGHKPVQGCYYNNSDIKEYELLQKSIENNKFLVGICKSAQWLTVVAGGWLIQDVDGHHGYHEIKTADGNTFTVNSSHHQMCFPYDLSEEDYEVLGWSNEVSSTYLIQGNKELCKPSRLHNEFKEPEVIWYPKIRGLGIQGHPEWSSMPAEFNKWANELILKLI